VEKKHPDVQKMFVTSYWQARPADGMWSLGPERYGSGLRQPEDLMKTK
jgi:hypothetical protein